MRSLFSISSFAACPCIDIQICIDICQFICYLPTLYVVFMCVFYFQLLPTITIWTILIHFVLYIIFIVEVKVNLLSTFLMTFNSYTKRARLVIDNTWQMYLWVSSCGKHDTPIYSHIAIMYSYKLKNMYRKEEKKTWTEWKWKYIERMNWKILSSSFSH